MLSVFILSSAVRTRGEYKNLSGVLGWDRKICPEVHRLASRGLPSDD